MERVINLGSLPASCGFQSDTGCFSNFFFEPIILVRTSIESRKKTEFTMIKLKGQRPYCPATPSEETTPHTPPTLEEHHLLGCVTAGAIIRGVNHLPRSQPGYRPGTTGLPPLPLKAWQQQRVPSTRCRSPCHTPPHLLQPGRPSGEAERWPKGKSLPSPP